MKSQPKLKPLSLNQEILKQLTHEKQNPEVALSHFVSACRTCTCVMPA